MYRCLLSDPHQKIVSHPAFMTLGDHQMAQASNDDSGRTISDPAPDPAAGSRLKLRRVAIDTYHENDAYLHRDCVVYRAEGFQALAQDSGDLRRAGHRGGAERGGRRPHRRHR
jgi:hypothetical protein